MASKRPPKKAISFECPHPCCREQPIPQTVTMPYHHRRPSAWSRRAPSVDAPDEGIHSLEEAFEQLDVHALKFLFLTRSWSLRIIWLLLFLAGCGAAGYYIRQICIEFQNHQTATKISTIIREEYDYPPIYICPRYNWDLTKASEHNVSRDAVIHAASLAQRNESHHPLPSLEEAQYVADHKLGEFIRQNPELRRATYAEFYKWMALSSKNILQEAVGMQSSDFSSVFVASPNQDNKPVNYRACYNVSAATYNPHSGNVFYLQYSIEKPNDSYSSLGSDSDFAFIKDDHRVVLEKDRIYLRKNRVTTIRLSLKRYSRRETKESKCIEPSEIKATSTAYSQEYCRYTCFAEAVDTCSRCKLLFEDTELIGSHLLCTWNFKPNLTTSCDENGHGATYKKCLTTCEPLCEYNSYDFSVAAVVINSNNYLDPRIGLSIYFLIDDGIMVFEEIPIYNIQTLISNIGGQMGLWTGASILTAIELVYLLTQFFCANWDFKKQEKRRRRAESIRQQQLKTDEDGKVRYEPVPAEEDEDLEKGTIEDEATSAEKKPETPTVEDKTNENEPLEEKAESSEPGENLEEKPKQAEAEAPTDRPVVINEDIPMVDESKDEKTSPTSIKSEKTPTPDKKEPLGTTKSEPPSMKPSPVAEEGSVVRKSPNEDKLSDAVRV